MRRALVGVVAATAAIATLAPTTPAFADSPLLHMSFDEDPVVTAIDGLGAGCPAFSGTLEEDRHLEINGFVKDDGTAHARTDVSASVTLTPDDPAAVAYIGGYTSHQTGVFTDLGDDDRQVTTTTHGTLTGSDGSSFRITEVVHFSIDRNGHVRAWFDRFHCE